MKLSLRFWTFMLCCVVSILSATSATLSELRSGGVFTIKSAIGNRYLCETEKHELNVRAELGDDAALWFIKSIDGKFYVYNAKTGRSLPSSGKDNTVLSTVMRCTDYFFREKGSGKFTISWNENFENGSCLNVPDTIDIVLKGNGNTTSADWIVEVPTASTASVTAVRQRFMTHLGYTQTPEPGRIYRLVNAAYTDRCLDFSGNELFGAVVVPNLHTQLWTFEKDGNRWMIKNAVSQKIVGNAAGTSQYYHLGDQNSYFTAGISTDWLPTLTFQGRHTGFHCAASRGHHVVGWTSNSWASHWYLQPVDVPQSELTESRSKYQLMENVNSDRTRYNNLLSEFFEDKACTMLKAAYAGYTDSQLRDAMTSRGLPTVFADMAVKVKKDQWNANDSEANRLEKSFRIAEYPAHSDHEKWAQSNELMRTSFRYSVLTNPTGITGETGEMALIFVDRPAPAGTTLRLQLVEGFSPTGQFVDLHEGVNAVSIQGKKHLYVYYNVDDVNKKLAEAPNIKIHIEGLRANGCYDMERHNNEDWKKMRTLKSHGFLQDEVIRMKSKRTCFSFHLSGVEEQEDKGEWNYGGKDMGIEGVLGLWDEVSDMELDLLSVEKFEDRFNCLLFAASNVGLYAKNYGTYYGTVSSLFSYKHLKGGGENYNGGNLWPIAHEVGHHFQQLFNIAGSLESSNNLFSNIAIWRTGRNVRRGEPHQDIIDHYNNGGSWMDAGIGRRMHMFWQLWLYYVELGHKPTFFKELIDKLRKEPIQGDNANTDMFRFARLCSDVAQEDLTEFFTLYGFFKEHGERILVKWGNDFYDGHYSPQYIRVDQADINATIAHMQQYPVKRNNLFFIDERIRPIPVDIPGVPPGTVRWGTTASATPGDAAEVGDVGHYTDFGKQQQTQAAPADVRLIGRSVIVSGEGAVGYKVYDKSNKLIMISNRNRFVLPENVVLADLIVKVGGGNGQDVEIIKEGRVLPQYVVTTPFDNTAKIVLSTNYDAPEAPYYIRLTPDASAFLNAETAYTANVEQKGKFAFFAGEQNGQYYIYSIDARKWLGYKNRDNGQNKVLLSAQFVDARPWNVVSEGQWNNAFDIKPLDENIGWNWYGGKTNPHTSMGFFSTTDDNSSWTLVPATPKTELTELILRSEELLAKMGVGYPNAQSQARRALQAAIQAAKASSAPTAGEVEALRSAKTNYQNSTVELAMPEEGKAYRIRHFLGRFIANAQTHEGSTPRPISMSDAEDNTTVWVAQRAADGKLCLASGLGTGCLSSSRSGNRGELHDHANGFQFARGSRFATLYLRTNNVSLSGAKGKSFLESINNHQGGNGNKDWGTDFYLDEVPDYAYVINVRAGVNGNYATLNLPFAVILPEGLVANKVVQEGDLLKLSPLFEASATEAQRVLPAYTPVLIKAATPGEYKLKPTTSVATQTTSTGLEGTISKKDNSTLEKGTYDYYVLTKNQDQYLMRIVGAANIPANRAYYRTEKSTSQVQAFFFDGNVTATETPVAEPSQNAPVYDLTGRRVKVPARTGLYIQNGRKVLKN